MHTNRLEFPFPFVTKLNNRPILFLNLILILKQHSSSERRNTCISRVLRKSFSTQTVKHQVWSLLIMSQSWRHPLILEIMFSIMQCRTRRHSRFFCLSLSFYFCVSFFVQNIWLSSKPSLKDKSWTRIDCNLLCRNTTGYHCFYRKGKIESNRYCFPQGN